MSCAPPHTTSLEVANLGFSLFPLHHFTTPVPYCAARTPCIARLTLITLPFPCLFGIRIPPNLAIIADCCSCGLGHYTLAVSGARNTHSSRKTSWQSAVGPCCVLLELLSIGTTSALVRSPPCGGLTYHHLLLLLLILLLLLRSLLLLLRCLLFPLLFLLLLLPVASQISYQYTSRLSCFISVNLPVSNYTHRL